MKRLRTAEDGYGGYTSVDVNGHIGNHESADLRRGRRGRPHGVDLFHDLRESGLRVHPLLRACHGGNEQAGERYRNEAATKRHWIEFGSYRVLESTTAASAGVIAGLVRSA